MDKLDNNLCSHLLLRCGYDEFVRLAIVNFRFLKVAKIIWKKWVRSHSVIKNYPIHYKKKSGKYGFCTMSYFKTRSGPLLHGRLIYVTNLNIGAHTYNYKIPTICSNSTKGKLNYKLGKLHGKCSFFNGTKICRIATYKNGSLNGPSVIYGPNRVESVRFYNRGRKCCVISIKRTNICDVHRREGLELIGWKDSNYLSLFFNNSTISI